MAREHEHNGKQFSMWWDPENQVVRSEAWGVNEEEDAVEYMECLANICRDVGKGELVDFLVDGRRLETMSRKARKIYAKMRDLAAIHRAVICGLNPLVKAILAFLILLPGSRFETKMVDSVEDGLRWLREQRAKKQ